MQVLSGSLHDHTHDSDGDTDAATVVAWLAQHRDQLGIDFATLSDHSDFFPVSYEAVLAQETSGVLDPWRHQAKLAQQYSAGPNGFALLRGFEFTNDQQNHLNVIGSQNWTSRFVTGDASLRMKPFWAWLGANPVTDPKGRGLGFGGGDGIGQFNHPGDKGALNWDDYAYSPSAARVMSTIEIHGDQGLSGGGLASSDAGWYWFALSQGWTVSPVMNWDWHEWTSGNVLTDPSPGTHCGDAGALPCQRSLVLATASSQAAIMAALAQRRTSASELPGLWATLRAGNTWQGTTIAAKPGSTITLTVDAGATDGELRSVDIVSDNGISPYPYYYGDNAPCDVSGCDPNRFSHSQLTPSYVEQHRRFVASNGHATRKARIDAPPPGTVVARAELTGARDTATITITVPNVPSLRADGKHFFYAIVHADAPASVGAAPGAARVWTGPILTL